MTSCDHNHSFAFTGKINDLIKTKHIVHCVIARGKNNLILFLYDIFAETK